MSFLLDTDVVAEVRKQRPHAAVREWFDAVREEELYLSVLVLGEVNQGIARLRRRDPRQAAAYASWLERLRSVYSDRLLPITEAIALEWGRLSAVRPLPVVDGLLAATARIHHLTLVTRNVADFAGVDVALLNPFA